MLDQLVDETNSEQAWDGYAAVMLKALLVHGAAWNEGRSTLRKALESPSAGDTVPAWRRSSFREFAPRLLGYGAVDAERLSDCTDQRVTLVGYGSFDGEGGRLYRLPLPPSLSGKQGWRRLTITLAWLTPINPNHRAYRRGVLSFTPITGSLQLRHPDVVECREDAGGLKGATVPYGIAVSLEVETELAIPLYEEMQERIRPQVQVITAIRA